MKVKYTLVFFLYFVLFAGIHADDDVYSITTQELEGFLYYGDSLRYTEFEGNYYYIGLKLADDKEIVMGKVPLVFAAETYVTFYPGQTVEYATLKADTIFPLSTVPVKIMGGQEVHFSSSGYLESGYLAGPLSWEFNGKELTFQTGEKIFALDFGRFAGGTLESPVTIETKGQSFVLSKGDTIKFDGDILVELKTDTGFRIISGSLDLSVEPDETVSFNENGTISSIKTITQKTLTVGNNIIVFDPVCQLDFYPSGALKGSYLKNTAPVTIGGNVLEIRGIITFHENGAVASCVPAKRTVIGEYSFNPYMYELIFDEQGQLTGYKSLR